MTRYLEIDSTFRNRNEWPDPGNFEVLISQTGSIGKKDALDPVCLSTPLCMWRSNYFAFNIGSGESAGPSPSAFITLDTFTDSTISYTTSLTTLICVSVAETQVLQKEANYYYNAVIISVSSTNPPERRRILSYKHLGNLSSGNTLDRVKIEIDSPFSYDILGQNLQIYDPTDITNYSRPLIFVPRGRSGKDSYNNYIITATNQNNISDYRHINSYDPNISIIDLNCTDNQVDPTIWNNQSYFCIRKQLPFYSGIISYVSSTRYITTSNNLPLTKENEYDYIGIGTSNNLITNVGASRIKKITKEGDNITIDLFEPFIFGSGDIYVDLLNFSYDNANPFNYTGSMISQQEEVCYEIKLLNLILPNQTLQTGEGSRIAFYPYVYIKLSTISSTGSGLKNIIYSNNPNSRNMLFRAPVTDVADPIITTHINLYGDDMAQVLKFKINDSMRFSVTLQNGDIYKTVDSEQYSPNVPNPSIQITALFSFTRVN